jgi:SAM-dependent methyltransferase
MAVSEATDVAGSLLSYVSPASGLPLRRDGDALVSDQNERYPIVREIPRFVSSEGYAASFGHEWNVHALTQLDSETGTSITRARLERCLGTSLDELRGRRVFEAGCGAGRFTELLVGAGALVHATDLSTAVDANRANIGSAENYAVAQADLRRPPYPPGSFEIVLCLGVLQHTPKPEESIRALWRFVRPGGQLVIDHYTWSLSRVTKLAWLYRAYLKRLPPERAKALTDRLVDVFFPLHWAVRHHFAAQALLSRISPCQVYFRALPELSKEQHFEFARLDTFDTLTDRYKHLRTARQIRTTLESLGAVDIEVWHGGNGVEARCRRPA